MSNRTAIVTGAAQGIGQAIVRRLAHEGVDRFLLVDRNEQGLRETADMLAGAGAACDTFTVDLLDFDGWRSRLDKKLKVLGTVHVLVNAAGSTARGGLDNTDKETFDALYGINVRAPFFFMQAAKPFMPTGGVIVNICSMLAYGGPPFLLAYSSSKAALVALTKGTANAVKRDGIHVFGINLGWTWTPGEQVTQTTMHGLPENWRETIGASQPFGRLLMPEDPAGLIAFLISKDAQMMTGAIIDLDQFVAGTVDDNPGAS